MMELAGSLFYLAMATALFANSIIALYRKAQSLSSLKLPATVSLSDGPRLHQLTHLVEGILEGEPKNDPPKSFSEFAVRRAYDSALEVAHTAYTKIAPPAMMSADYTNVYNLAIGKETSFTKPKVRIHDQKPRYSLH